MLPCCNTLTLVQNASFSPCDLPGCGSSPSSDTEDQGGQRHNLEAAAAGVRASNLGDVAAAREAALLLGLVDGDDGDGGRVPGSAAAPSAAKMAARGGSDYTAGSTGDDGDEDISDAELAALAAEDPDLAALLQVCTAT
jgi:hypothetical protein